MPQIVMLWAWGGTSRYHDYLMSDGTVQCFHDTETEVHRLPVGTNFATVKDKALSLYKNNS